MKSKFIYYILCLILINPLIFTSCKKDYLDVVDPTVLSTANYPKKVADLEYLLVDIYGRLQDGFFSDNFRAEILLSHNNNHGYNGAEFNEFALNILNPNLSIVKLMWEAQYSTIGQINGFLAFIDDIRNQGTLTATDIARLNQMEGEAKFIRALNYFYLVNLYGESPILTEADKQKMGVPIWDVNTSLINETSKPRATQGEVFDFIVSDLKSSETLLKGVVFAQKPRVNEWAVKSLLAKVYVHMLRWTEARDIFKDVIDNSGKGLVSYTIFRNMFNGIGANEFNSESIFEVNSTPDPLDQTNLKLNTGNQYPRYIAATYINATGVTTNIGWCNLAIHDKTLPRYGWDDPATTIEDYKTPAFKAKSLQVRLDKSIDPRLYVSTQQPYIDTVNFVGVWRKVGKSFFEGYSNINYKAWCNKKYTLNERAWNTLRSTEINFIVLRLADLYLLYAETLIKTGNPVLGLEYINRVHRRAYSQPVNTPSIYDYASLTDRTKTVEATDHLANDPLKYERWAELFCEGNWWFDVRRWDLGSQEAAYYKTVMAGQLQWVATKYAWPIPTSEINSNSKIIQNPGY